MTKVVFAFASLSLAVFGAAPAFAQMPADASYVLKVDAPAAKKGEKTVAHLHITPGAGYHVNKDYPLALTLTAPAGVTLDKSKLTAKDAAKLAESEAQLDIAYTAAKPGKQMVTGEIKFAVCSANTCDPKKSTVSFQIDVR